ncbi:alpha/beta hydrolase [Streptomyces sp. NBC_00063]|uniref:alpha/beta hydrolase n=1 Tax=Streptomyces sp. NBC_00063 TaxID=2975638 RepID=UPI003D75ED03
MGVQRVVNLVREVTNFETVCRFYEEFGLQQIAPGTFATVSGEEELILRPGSSPRVVELNIGADTLADLDGIADGLTRLGLSIDRSGDAVSAAEPGTQILVRASVVSRFPTDPPPTVPMRVDHANLIDEENIRPRAPIRGVHTAFHDAGTRFQGRDGESAAVSAGPSANGRRALSQPRIDPQISEALRTKTLSHIDWQKAGLDQIPSIRAAMARGEDSSAQEGLAVLDVDLGTGPAGVLRARLIRPRSTSAPLPCLYWIHGGGYFSGSAFERDDRLTAWARDADIAVVSVEYRLAPENPYPAPFDDCWAGLAGLFAKADEFGVDQTRIGVGGASAGGGLAAAVALATKYRGGPSLAFQLLVAPMIDDRGITESSRMTVPLWPRAANELGWTAYLGSTASIGVSEFAAPARAADLSGLPPTYLCVGTADLFRDENVDYARRMLSDGTEVELNLLRGAPHAFHTQAPESTLTRRSLADIGRFLRDVAGRDAGLAIYNTPSVH